VWVCVCVCVCVCVHDFKTCNENTVAQWRLRNFFPSKRVFNRKSSPRRRIVLASPKVVHRTDLYQTLLYIYGTCSKFVWENQMLALGVLTTAMLERLLHVCRVKITFFLLSSCHYVAVFYKPFNIHIYYTHLHSHMWQALESACCRFAASKCRLHYYRRIIRSHKNEFDKIICKRILPPPALLEPVCINTG